MLGSGLGQGRVRVGLKLCGRTDGVYGLPVGYQAKAVLENSSGMKQRHGYSHDALQPVL